MVHKNAVEMKWTNITWMRYCVVTNICSRRTCCPMRVYVMCSVCGEPVQFVYKLVCYESNFHLNIPSVINDISSIIYNEVKNSIDYHICFNWRLKLASSHMTLHTQYYISLTDSNESPSHFHLQSNLNIPSTNFSYRFAKNPLITPNRQPNGFGTPSIWANRANMTYNKLS